MVGQLFSPFSIYVNLCLQLLVCRIGPDYIKPYNRSFQESVSLIPNISFIYYFFVAGSEQRLFALKLSRFVLFFLLVVIKPLPNSVSFKIFFFPSSCVRGCPQQLNVCANFVKLNCQTLIHSKGANCMSIIWSQKPNNLILKFPFHCHLFEFLVYNMLILSILRCFKELECRIKHVALLFSAVLNF